MTIAVECPICEERFHLDPDMVGKTTRCQACKAAFVVAASAAPVRPVPIRIQPREDLPYERIDTGEFSLPDNGRLQVDDSSSLQPDVVPTLLPNRKPKPPTALPALPKPQIRPVPKPPMDDIPTLLPAGPRERAWSADVAPPEPRSSERTRPDDDIPTLMPTTMAGDLDEDVDEALAERRRKRRGRSRGKWIALSLLFAILFTSAATAFGLWRYNALAEQRLFDAAKVDYDEGNFVAAKEKYEQLLTEYPESSESEQYRFFAALTGTQAAVRSPAAIDNPMPAHDTYLKFTTEFALSPWAAPETGYGSEIVQLGKQLADVLADRGNALLNAFRADRKKLEELTQVGTTVQVGRDLLPVVEKFREKNGVPLDAQRARFEELSKQIVRENHRLQVLLPYRNLADEPTAFRIEEFEKVLKDNELSTDAEARTLLAEAERRLREMPGYISRRRPAGALVTDPDAPILLTAPIGVVPKTAPNAADQAPIFSVARGVLYALDPATGRERWGARLASPSADLRSVDLPTPAVVGEDDWVFVVGEVAGVPGLTARRSRTGEVIWHQPLEAKPAGRPLVVGSRVYVPLSDDYGTVVECEATSGIRLGDLSIRRPIGAGLSAFATGRPGAAILVVPADAKQVFLFELGREDADGNRIAPRRVRVLVTEHPRGSLRGEAAIVQSADDAGPRTMILTQTDGPTTMKLRSFALPRPEEIIAAGETVPAESRERAAEVGVAGWSWFPAVSNGERLLLASDAGAFFAFGVNQNGSNDAPLFAIPTPKPPKEQEGVSRSLIVTAEEDAYWVVVGGQLLRFRTAVTAAEGLRIVADGPGRPIGEPIHRAQVRPNIGSAFVTTRDSGGSVQAVSFDLATGQNRWVRRLGIVPAAPAVAIGKDRAVVVDEDGGAYLVTASGESKLISVPPAGAGGKASVTASADRRTVWIAMPETDKAGRRIRLRSIVDGVLKVDEVVPLPDQPAGPAAVVGAAVVLPLANGYLYRFAEGDSQLMVGPLWRGDGGAGEVQCAVTPLADDEFLATDGGRTFLRWKWPSEPGAKPAKIAGPWEVPAKIALPPIPIASGGVAQFAAIDVQGVLYFYAADQPGGPLRRKRPAAGGIPFGRPMRRLSNADADWIAYTVADRHLVCISVNPMVPDFVVENVVPLGAPDLLDLQDRLLSDPAGAVARFDASTRKLGPWLAPRPGLPPLTIGAVVISPTAAVAVGMDGCGRLIALPPGS